MPRAGGLPARRGGYTVRQRRNDSSCIGPCGCLQDAAPGWRLAALLGQIPGARRRRETFPSLDGWDGNVFEGAALVEGLLQCCCVRGTGVPDLLSGAFRVLDTRQSFTGFRASPVGELRMEGTPLGTVNRVLRNGNARRLGPSGPEGIWQVGGSPGTDGEDRMERPWKGFLHEQPDRFIMSLLPTHHPKTSPLSAASSASCAEAVERHL